MCVCVCVCVRACVHMDAYMVCVRVCIVREKSKVTTEFYMCGKNSVLHIFTIRHWCLLILELKMAYCILVRIKIKHVSIIVS